MKTVYYLLSITGTIIPLYFFLPWVYDHGLAIGLLLSIAFDTPISSFAWSDVIISAVVLILFIQQEVKKIAIPLHWICYIALFTVGVSLAFPLFLALRERSRNIMQS